MIKVYFESRATAVLVAIFDHEEMYDICRPALEKKAEEEGKTLTESCENTIEMIVDEIIQE